LPVDAIHMLFQEEINKSCQRESHAKSIRSRELNEK
jgi:hypothetical protein